MGIRGRCSHANRYFPSIPSLIGRVEKLVDQKTVANGGDEESSNRCFPDQKSTDDNSREQGGESHIAPPMNTNETPTFCLRDIFRRHTIGRGRMKMKRSETKFMDPYANAALIGMMQWPGTCGSQYLVIGVQPNIWVRKLLDR